MSVDYIALLLHPALCVCVSVLPSFSKPNGQTYIPEILHVGQKGWYLGKIHVSHSQVKGQDHQFKNSSIGCSKCSQRKLLRKQVRDTPLRPPRGSVNLILTKFIHLVSLEQFHHKPMGMYAGGVLKLTLGGK